MANDKLYLFYFTDLFKILCNLMTGACIEIHFSLYEVLSIIHEKASDTLYAITKQALLGRKNCAK